MWLGNYARAGLLFVRILAGMRLYTGLKQTLGGLVQHKCGGSTGQPEGMPLGLLSRWGDGAS